MNVHVERRWDRQVVQVWFFERVPDGVRVFRMTEGIWDDTVSHGEAWPEPSLEIPEQWFGPLLEAAIDFAPPSSAQAEHLADARAVRDRLLTLVEGANTPRQRTNP